MKDFTSNRGKLLAVSLCVFLLASIFGTCAAVFALGDDWLRPAAPVLRWDTILFSNAVFLLVIGWTDLPEKIRRSIAVRAQVQCWAIWQVLLGFLVLMTLGQINLIVVFSVLCGVGIALLAYSLGSVYRALRA